MAAALRAGLQDGSGASVNGWGPTRALRDRRWPAGFFAVFLCLGFALGLMRPSIDPDLGWHLRTGQLILATHAVPVADVFSFTKAGANWVDQEWLWQVLLATVARLAGTAGLVAVKSVVAPAAIALVYLVLRARGVPQRFSVIGAAGALLLLVPYSEARPAMVGPLFSAAFLLVLERYRTTRDWHWLAALLPCELIWANAHSSYVLGLFLCGIYAVAEFWDARSLASLKLWAALLASLLAISVINPRGIGLLRFTLTAAGLSFNRDYVAEWQAPVLAKWPGVLVLVMLILSIAVGALYRDWAAKKRQLLLLVICTPLALLSQQFEPLYAVAVAPILAEVAFRLVGRPEDPYLPRGFASCLILALIAVAAVGPGRNLTAGSAKAAVDHTFPTQAVAFIEQQHLAGPMFNEYDWGGYLIQTLPHLPVFVDGRSEVYGEDFLRQWMAVKLATEPADPVFSHYGINLALIEPHSALATELRANNTNWREAYTDNVASVFVRTDQVSSPAGGGEG